MNIEGIYSSVEIFLAYFLIVIVLSSLILKCKVCNENIFKRFMIYIVFGNIYISSIVFLLAYANIFSRMTLIITISVFSIVLRILFDFSVMKSGCLNVFNTLIDLILRRYGFKLFIYDNYLRIKSYINNLTHELFFCKKTEWFLFVSIMAYNIYQYSANTIRFTTYMAPDEEVHLYWIQSLIKGSIFPSGVYPHVFHNIISALISVFNLNASIVIQYFSITSSVLVMTMLYLGLRKLFKSMYPALLGFMIYSTANIYIEQATNRFQFSIPQEYGMIMLIPISVFLFDYLKNKKTKDLVFFGLSLSLSFSIHFYTGIIGLILMISIFTVYSYKIIKKKLFSKLIVCIIISAFVSVAPLATGLFLGHPLEQSMGWALDVFRGDVYKESSGKNDIKVENETKEDDNINWDNFKTNAKVDLLKYGVTDIRIIYGFIILIITSFFYSIIKFIDTRKEKYKYILSFTLNLSILFSLMLFKPLGLPTIMEPKRVMIFLAYFSSMLLGMPLEIIETTLKHKKRKLITIFSLFMIFMCLFIILKFNYLRPLSAFYYFQPSGTIRVNESIMKNYKDFTWTAVSPVNNISSVLNHGFHYELSEFIIEQENWDKKKEIRIPTEYVFIYIEKKPIVDYGDRFHRDDYQVVDRNSLKREDAYKDFSGETEDNYVYKKERNILMAKAYCWAERYIKYFPDEMNIYYEDDELVVYRVMQNTYALNNFSIDYEINRK